MHRHHTPLVSDFRTRDAISGEPYGKPVNRFPTDDQYAADADYMARHEPHLTNAEADALDVIRKAQKQRSALHKAVASVLRRSGRSGLADVLAVTVGVTLSHHFDGPTVATLTYNVTAGNFVGQAGSGAWRSTNEAAAYAVERFFRAAGLPRVADLALEVVL